VDLNPPNKNTFWAAVIIATAGWLVYAAHLITLYLFHSYTPHLQMISCVLVSIAFVVLCLGVIFKGH
jgi:uncharacterized membrane protein YhdT